MLDETKGKYVLYRWEDKRVGVLYFVALVQEWNKFKRDDKIRIVLAQGTETQMVKYLSLAKGETNEPI